MTKIDLLAASAIALLFASPAMAQTVPAESQGSVAQDGAVQGNQDADPDDFQSANDIVVTATRRNETVQEVPIAITAVGNELIENAGVQDIRGLEQLAPSLQTTTGQSQSSGASLSLRGIGTAGDNPGFEPAVGVFIDGVFRARAGIALAELPELERVEILRGPQGTLFGRNTSAGALSIFTAQPQFEFEGFVEGSYGNFDAYEINGGITGPVTEQIALRIDGGYRKRDGYIEDINSDRAINDVDRYYVRGQALFESENLSFRLIGDYRETDEICCGAVSGVRGPLAAVINSIATPQGLVGLPTNVAPEDRRQAISPNRSYTEQVKDYGVSGEFNLDIGDIKLTSITAYRDFEALRDQDIDFSGIDRAYRDDYLTTLTDFTQEFRVQGSLFDDAVDFLVGGFYLNEKLDLRDTVRIGNDGNRYVDTIFAGALAPSFGTPAQFFGSLGPTVPLLGQVLLNPGVPSAAFGPIAPLIGCFRAQAGTGPAAGCVIPGFPSAPIPGLAALATSPLPGAVAGQGNNNDNFAVDTQAFALFTHNIINVTDQLSLTLGVRYNYEKKELDASINNNLGSCSFFNQVRAGNPAANAYANVLRTLGVFNNLFLLSCNPAVNTEFNGNYSDDRSESEFTGTAKVAFKVTEDILAYGSYDRGYKSGGYNLDQASFGTVLLGGDGAQATDLEFDKETVDAYEVGVKTSFGREFTLNIAGFYQKFKGLQSLIFAGNNFIVQNVDKATSKGIEAEAIIQPVRELTVRFGYTYNEAEFDEDNVFAPTSPLFGSNGRQFTDVPKNVVTAAATYVPRLTDRLNGLLHVDMRYNEDVNLVGTPNPLTGRATVRNEGYPLVAARIGVQTEDDKFGVEFFVENVFEQYYNITGFPVPEQTGNFAVYPSPPRFYGVKARVGF